MRGDVVPQRMKVAEGRGTFPGPATVSHVQCIWLGESVWRHCRADRLRSVMTPAG